jgi:hypothetical protein
MAKKGKMANEKRNVHATYNAINQNEKSGIRARNVMKATPRLAECPPVVQPEERKNEFKLSCIR